MDARLSDALSSAPAAPTLGGPGPLAPVPAEPKPRTARVRVTSEVVGVRGALGGYYRSLPPWIDDLTREFGPDTYDRMQLDDQVSSSLRALCHGVLSDELVVRPGVDDKKDPDFAAAKDAVAFCERATWQQTGGLDQWLLTMVKGAVGGGNRVSETVYRPEESGRDAGKWVLDRLKVKPRRSVAFAVDSCNNLAGILGLPPGGATWGGLAWGTTFDPADPPDNFLPRDKFCVLTWDPHDEDPRGSAILRCVYEPWWAKLQAAREWLAYLAQFGSPGLVGTTAPGADSSAPTDAYGNPVDGDVLTPEQDMLNKILDHRNGGVHVLPNGATLDILQSSNAGDAFLKKVDSADRAIAQGINLAMRAVMQSRFGSRADAEQGQDVAGLQTRFLKRWLARMVTEDLLRPLVRINYGPDAARRLCPYASLSPVEHQDLGASLVAVSGAWKNGLIKNSQLPWVYEQFGMPPATEEELAAPPPGSVPPGAPPGAGGGPDGGGGQDPLAQALLKQGPPAGGSGGAPFAWDESKHPRGQPENAGQFGPGGGGKAAEKDKGGKADTPGPASWPVDWQRHVERDRGRGDHVTSWTYRDGSDAYEQNVYVVSGTYDPDPEDPDSEPVDVWRWESRDETSGTTDTGDWTPDEDEAAEGGRRFARESDQEEPDEEPDEEEESDGPDEGQMLAKAEALRDATTGPESAALVGLPDLGPKSREWSQAQKYEPHYSGEPEHDAWGWEVEFEHPDLKTCKRFFGIDAGGDKFIRNEELAVKPDKRKGGVSSRIFAGQVEAASAAGYSYLQCHAAGDKDSTYKGYYVWPLFGYDEALDSVEKTNPSLARKVRAEYPDADSILDVLEEPGGIDWWRENGDDLYDARFDLAEGSRSRRVLAAYLAEKGRKGS
jgi:hypothetical protein